jgi:hypothetical protein
MRVHSFIRSFVHWFARSYVRSLKLRYPNTRIFLATDDPSFVDIMAERYGYATTTTLPSPSPARGAGLGQEGRLIKTGAMRVKGNVFLQETDKDKDKDKDKGGEAASESGKILSDTGKVNNAASPEFNYKKGEEV